MEHYLDNAATTKVCPEAAEAAMRAMTHDYGNPSSTHTKGREADKLLSFSRVQVAKALGCEPKELVFTSCGSESNNWALSAGADYMKRKGRHIISSELEHESVRRELDRLESLGYEITKLRGDKTGAVSPAAVGEALREDTILVSLMAVNNETGAVTDIKGISELLKKSGSQALLHSDAVQAFMKIPFKASALGADMISISGHKIHAPKGIGGLYIRDGLKLPPLILGGGQEGGRRAGTEAMPQIAAFGAACEAAMRAMPTAHGEMATRKKLIIDTLRPAIPELRYIPSDTPHILSLSMPGWRSEVLMNFLEARGVYVSKSSACKKGGRSRVLEAVGMSAEEIDGALRIGLSRFTTDDDIEALCLGLIAARELIAHM